MKRNPGASGRAGGDESGRVSSCRAFKVKVRSLQGHGSHWRGSAQRRDPTYVCKCRPGPIVSVAPVWRQDVKEVVDITPLPQS